MSGKALNLFMVTSDPHDLEKTSCKVSSWLHWNCPSPKPYILTFPYYFFGAVSQRYLRCCLLGCSPHFTLNKTQLATLKLCTFFSWHVRIFTILGKQTLAGYKQNVMCTRTQEKGAVAPQETEPDLPVGVQESLVDAWVDSGLLRGQRYGIKQCWHKSFWSTITPTIFAWNVPLVSLIFLKRSLVFPIPLFSSISLHWSLIKAFLSLLAILWNSAFRCLYLSLSPLLFASLLFTAICKASPDRILPLDCKLPAKGPHLCCSFVCSQYLERYLAWSNCLMNICCMNSSPHIKHLNSNVSTYHYHLCTSPINF